MIYYLYRGYSLYCETENGVYHYDYAAKKWLPSDAEWDLNEMENVEKISAERASHFAPPFSLSR